MPGPYEWKHGWIPLTANAARQKNHGRKPGPKSKVSQQMDTAIRSRGSRNKPSAPPQTTSDLRAATERMREARKGSEATRKAVEGRTPQKPAATPQGSNASGGPTASDRRKIREQIKANEERAAAPARAEAAKAGFTGPQKNTPKGPAGIPADAPKQLRQVAEAAEANGWTTRYGSGETRDGEKRHGLRVRGPEGEQHDLTWTGNKRDNGYNQPTTKAVIDAINNPDHKLNAEQRRHAEAQRAYTETVQRNAAERERHHSMTAQERFAEQNRREREAAAKARQEHLETARREEAKNAAERSAAVERERAAQQHRDEAARELEAKRKQKPKEEQATDLNRQAVRAYKARDYEQALRLFDQAAALDPARAGEFAFRRTRVQQAMRKRGATPRG